MPGAETLLLRQSTKRGRNRQSLGEATEIVLVEWSVERSRIAQEERGIVERMHCRDTQTGGTKLGDSM